MQEEQIKKHDADLSASNADSAATREVSSIQFPYGDLDDAISFVKSIHQIGGQECMIDQLAAHLKVTASGGAFRARMAPPRVFGLVDYERGNVKLTPLGMRIVDPSQEVSAKIEAFLAVPLFKAIYEKYKGYSLPPPAALARDMGVLGVSSKQTDRARQVFDRSAKQSGFFWAGADRLTLPITKGKPPETRPLDNALRPPPPPRLTGGGGSGNDGDFHPFVQGLLQTMPEPGTVWAIEGRAAWLETAANIFKLIYQGDGKILITAEQSGDKK
jgi:hypothetical protein